MALKIWTTNYPASLDTVTEQPVIVDDDDIDESHVNIMSQVVQELQSQVGSNTPATGSLRSITGFFQQHLPRLTWTDVTTISVAAWPGQSSTIYARLQDNIWRSFTGTLTFSPAVSGEGGLDTGSEADVWYYLYLVPTAADDSLLTVVGSATTPATGPTGYTNFKYIGAVKNLSGSLVAFWHTERDRFSWTRRSVEVSGTSWDATPVKLTLAYVPATASAAEVQGRLQIYGSGYGDLLIWADDGSVPANAYSNWAMWVGVYSAGNWDHGHSRGIIPLMTPQSLYYRRFQGSGSLNASSLDITGWVDLYLT